ncbi:hypothetical protein T484DRAFT_3448170 [Baffinella frigidus]|nr:hypothetical protein T484DRAFT_3448170 [Cryptophyta sp. CCMP2293]
MPATPSALVATAIACLSFEPCDRPAFAEVVARLSAEPLPPHPDSPSHPAASARRAESMQAPLPPRPPSSWEEEEAGVFKSAASSFAVAVANARGEGEGAARGGALPPSSFEYAAAAARSGLAALSTHSQNGAYNGAPLPASAFAEAGAQENGGRGGGVPGDAPPVSGGAHM